jgi:hypothetical protein
MIGAIRLKGMKAQAAGEWLEQASCAEKVGGGNAT